MKDLIERLEKATGPDRALDIAILKAANPYDYLIEDDGTILVSGDMGDGPGWFNIGYDVPAYTASIDAALTLVPEGPTWQVTGRVKEDGDYFADVNVDHRCDSAPTPALALCIAALKARGEPQ